MQETGWCKIVLGVARVKVGPYWIHFEEDEIFPKECHYQLARQVDLPKSQDFLHLINVSPTPAEYEYFSRKILNHLCDLETKKPDALINGIYGELKDLGVHISNRIIGERIGRTREWVSKKRSLFYRGLPL